MIEEADGVDPIEKQECNHNEEIPQALGEEREMGAKLYKKDIEAHEEDDPAYAISDRAGVEAYRCRMLVVFVVLQAEPAELHLAFPAYHTLTPTILVYVDAAARAGLCKERLPEVVQECPPFHAETTRR